MKKRNKFLAVMATFTLGATIFLSGCGANPMSSGKPAQGAPESSNEVMLGETGVLTLSVNPEIRIEYNKDGEVTAISGANADGEGIVSSYQDYVGKNCEVVLEELIVEIHEAGYFVDDIDGHKKNIVIQLEPGSVLPDDHFLEDLSRNTQEAVQGLDFSSGIVTIDDDDYDPAYAKNGKPSHYITLDKAQEIALIQANVNAADAVFADKEFDFDDGVAVFELEFTANGKEYDYDVDAVTGKVLKAQHETAGVNNDTDYGPDNDGVTDYSMTDYGPDNDGVTDYGNTDYGPDNDGVTDYNDTDYGQNNDGVTDYNDGKTNYDNGDSGYDD